MKHIVLSFLSLLALTSAQAQDYITDDQVESKIMAQDDELKVFYFTATWCGPCKYMKPFIESTAADENVDATIYRMDIDQNITDNVMEVPGVPSFFFVKNGQVLGQHTGAIPEADFRSMIDKNNELPLSGEYLQYKPVPSQYQLVAGSHKKLTKRNLKKLWHSPKQLMTTAMSIHNNLNDARDLKAALVLANRSNEIAQEGMKMHLIAALESRLGRKKDALETAKNAREQLLQENQSIVEINKLIAQLS
ncbi:thioredoxin family protein [Nonlabens ponticola]|uniref:Thioredoxin n=1 Tax=Nonlabens ponticola TaxID=2496866 RepID=A0A3S9MY20_9FLAO|nr:thioredoxin family protein [Nonlabens ponticola]AZQ44038.1 thioredoxin [Nonlabens ponticola]